MDKELAEQPERDHTEILTEQLEKARTDMKKTYKVANQEKLNTF